MADPVTATGGYQLVPVTRSDGETVYVRADKADAPVMATFNERGQRSNRDLRRDDVSGAPEGSGFWDTRLGQYLRSSYEGLARGAKAVREAADPFQYAGQAAQGAASVLPGAGLVEGQQDFGRMGQALKEGRYRDAAIDAGYGLVNAGTEFIPAMAAMPAIRRPGANIAERAQPRPGETIAYVDPAAVDEAWRADPDFYIPPGAGTGKYEGAVEYLQGAGPVEAPSLGVMPDSLGFADGRNRFAAMRDMGLDRIPVSMEPASLENARARGLIDDPPPPPPRSARGPARVDTSHPQWTLYHGTEAPVDFDRFDPGNVALKKHSTPDQDGVFLAPSPDSADVYANGVATDVAGAAGPRIFKVNVDPGRSATFDVADMARNDPAFIDMIHKTNREGQGRDTSKMLQSADQREAWSRKRLSDALAQADSEAEMWRGFGRMTEEEFGMPVPSQETIARKIEEARRMPYSTGAVSAAVRHAREQGYDTVVIRGLAEHGGSDQVVALTPGRVRNAFDGRLLYGLAGAGVGLGGSLAQRDQQDEM